jgi:hypothetical protein
MDVETLREAAVRASEAHLDAYNAWSRGDRREAERLSQRAHTAAWRVYLAKTQMDKSNAAIVKGPLWVAYECSRVAVFHWKNGDVCPTDFYDAHVEFAGLMGALGYD